MAHLKEDTIETEFQQIREIIEESLIGETVYTLARHRPNDILDADEDGLTVRARTESEVPWEWIEGVYEALVHLEAIEPKDVQRGEFRVRGGFRSSFIFALLARFAHIEPRTNPIRLIYREPPGAIRLGGGGEK